MDKILNFSFTNTTVNKDQILKLINLYENENYFELIDNCLSKNRNKVNKIINDHNGKIEFIPIKNGAKINIKFLK